MVAEGPGELKTREDDRLGQSHVRWHEKLEMTTAPNGEPGNWIELTGNTLVESQERGFMASDRLEIWLRKNTNGPAPAASTLSRDMAAGYVVNRLYSSTKTIVGTPAVKAQVDQLDIQIKYESSDRLVLNEDGIPVGEQSLEPDKATLSLRDAGGNPMYQFVSPPETIAEKKDEPKPMPISITGSELNSTIVTAGKTAWIEQLSISGPVKVWRESILVDGKQTLPWHIEGNLMLGASNRLGQMDMQVEGKPAKIVLADGRLEGPAVRLNQEHNIVLVDHPGEFVLPKSLLKTSVDARGSEFEWVDPPLCKWQKRMIFDGQRAIIEGAVDLTGSIVTNTDEYWLLTGNCERVDVELKDRVELSSSETVEGEVERLVLRNQVNIFASQLDARGEKRSRQHLVVPLLTFHVPTEEVHAQGTGWIKSWFVPEGRLGRLASSQDSTQGLRAAHLQFRDEMVGKLGSSTLSFRGKVELFSGKIRNWEESLDVTQAGNLKQDQILLNADTLQVFDAKSLSTTRLVTSKDSWEFLATGNVAFNAAAEAGDFSGNGQRLSYRQMDDQIILRGSERDPAFVQRIGKDGKVYQGNLNFIELDAKTMTPSNAVLGVGGVRVDDNNQPTFGELPHSTLDPRKATESFYNRAR